LERTSEIGHESGEKMRERRHRKEKKENGYSGERDRRANLVE
jgi:hypothetical protein